VGLPCRSLVRQWFAVSCVVEYRSSALPQIKITPNVRSSNSAYLIGPGAPWSNNEEGIFLIDFGAPPVHDGSRVQYPFRPDARTSLFSIALFSGVDRKAAVGGYPKRKKGGGRGQRAGGSWNAKFRALIGSSRPFSGVVTPSCKAKTFFISFLDVESPIWYYFGVGCSRLSAVAFVSP